MMKFIKVPDDIFNNSEDVLLIPYENPLGLEKKKVLFSKFAFIFVIAGTKQIYFREEPVKVSQKQFSLIGKTRCLMTEKIPTNKGKYKALLLFFPEKIFLQAISKINNEENITEKNEILIFQHNEYTENYLQTLTHLATQKNNRKELLNLKLLELILYLSLKYSRQIQGFINCYKDSRKLHFQKTIEENLFSNLSNEELAFLCNMSLSTFKRTFKKIYNTTPKKWFFERKMKEIKLLLESGYSPSELYKKAGYSSLSNFLRAYRKFKDMNL